MLEKLGALLFVLVATHAAAPGTETNKPSSPCTAWTGTVSGNDPSVSIAANLCEDGKGHVTGSLTWTSDRSGVNVRAVEGAWSSDHAKLSMADVAITESRPNPGWRFCLVDSYELAGSASSVAGTYHSSACSDEARVTLARAK